MGSRVFGEWFLFGNRLCHRDAQREVEKGLTYHSCSATLDGPVERHKISAYWLYWFNPEPPCWSRASIGQLRLCSHTCPCLGVTPPRLRTGVLESNDPLRLESRVTKCLTPSQ